MSHALYLPPPVTNCHTFSDPLPLERDILYGRPHSCHRRKYDLQRRYLILWSLEMCSDDFFLKHALPSKSQYNVNNITILVLSVIHF